MESKWIKLTPKLALSYLEGMGDSNRMVKQGVVNSYASQMRQGLWRKNPQPVILDKAGVMVDGQHRCWAVVESGVDIPVMLVNGMDREDVVTVDRGAGRDYKDVAHFMGWQDDHLAAGIVKFLVVAPGQANKVYPPDVLHAWYEHYKDAVDFAVSLRNGCRPMRGKSINVNMAAAFARAHAFGCDPALLARLGAILKTGLTEVGVDQAALSLRDAWLTGRLGTSRAEVYFKTEAAIRSFVDRKPLKKLQRPDGELFPLKSPPASIRYEDKDYKASPKSGMATRTKVRSAKAQKAA